MCSQHAGDEADMTRLPGPGSSRPVFRWTHDCSINSARSQTAMPVAVQDATQGFVKSRPGIWNTLLQNVLGWGFIYIHTSATHAAAID